MEVPRDLKRQPSLVSSNTVLPAPSQPRHGAPGLWEESPNQTAAHQVLYDRPADLCSHNSTQGALASALYHASGPLKRLFSLSPPAPLPFPIILQVQACRSLLWKCLLGSARPHPGLEGDPHLQPCYPLSRHSGLFNYQVNYVVI